MASKIGVLVIHGMGDQDRGFSNKMIRELKGLLKEDAGTFEFGEVYWAKTLHSREKQMLDCMREAKEPSGARIDLDWMKARRFIVHNFGDALAYHRDADKAEEAYGAIHDVVDRSVQDLQQRLGDPTAPVMVIAHSLGAQIMSDYIWDRQKKKDVETRTALPTLLAMVTFGCNIPLFSLAYPIAKPILLPGKGIRKAKLKEASRWLNFLDADDVLGWPLRPLYEKNRSQLKKGQQATIDRIEDYEINVGSFVTKWNPAAHGSYWTDNDMTRPIAQFMRGLARAL